MIDRARIEAAVAELISAIGDDPARTGLTDTPQRVAAAYAEFFSGVGVDAAESLGPTIADEHGGDLVLVRDLDFRSVCEHHLLPFIGRAHIAYLPADRLAGLGRLPRVIDTLASRPQLQERLTEEIADVLESRLHPRGVLVMLDARHQCVSTRGARQVDSSTVSIAWRGAFADPAERAVVLAMIGSASG